MITDLFVPNQPAKGEILILSGLQASGKSTYAAELATADENVEIINYDSLRVVMFGQGWEFNYPEENKMKALAMAKARIALAKGRKLVIDNLNLNKHMWGRWLELGGEMKVPVRLENKFLEISIDECIKRDRKREKRVGQAVIDRTALWNGMSKIGTSIIVDVDGTLADLAHRRHFLEGPKKDWDGFFANVSDDQLIKSIAQLVRSIEDMDDIIIVSGRPIDKCGIATEDWLIKHGVPFYHLFMRQGGDFRPDTVVKQEILDRLPKDKIKFVLDDRNSVVKMWRDNGLTCLQVADGDF